MWIFQCEDVRSEWVGAGGSVPLTLALFKGQL